VKAKQLTRLVHFVILVRFVTWSGHVTLGRFVTWTGHMTLWLGVVGHFDGDGPHCNDVHFVAGVLCHGEGKGSTP